MHALRVRAGLFLAGTIEEKIYQRQLSKGELASVMGGSAAQAPGGFSRYAGRELVLSEHSFKINAAWSISPTIAHSQNRSALA